MARKNIKPLYLSYPRRISRIFTPYERIELFEIIPTTVVQIIYVNPSRKAEIKPMSEKFRYFSEEFTLRKTEATIFVFPMIRVVTNVNIVIV